MIQRTIENIAFCGLFRPHENQDSYAMTSIIGVFAISFLLPMSLTPGVIHFANRYWILDMPSPRKVHLEQIPRAGGIAIYLAFFLSFFTGKDASACKPMNFDSVCH